MIELSEELGRLRDSMLNMSEILQEFQLKIPSNEVDEVRTKVERYLCELRKLT